MASFLSTRARERSTPNGVLFSFFGGATPSSNRALRAFGAQNPVRIRRPKIDKLACQAQGARILAKGEIPGAREEQAPPLSLTPRPFYAIMEPTIRKAVEI